MTPTTSPAMAPRSLLGALLLSAAAVLAPPPVHAQQCPAAVPVQGAPVPPPLPVFPADNWWNVDVSTAPVDAGSAAFINFIGPTRGMHPDFGGTAGGDNIYGFPYAIVNGSQPKQAFTFQYWSESDGVNMATGQGIPFYPVPAQSITERHWIEGGPPGNVDLRNANDRHLLVIDCTNRHLYELYNVWYSTAQARWYGGSGAFFDMNTNNRRPQGWTSADASGLAIFPGLVRYDEAGDPAVTEIRHALRVTVRATNGHVYPASHTAGSTSGALPLGARLRLKTSVNGSDPALRTSDPIARKVFRAMQKYGLIVADNGSDLYVSGTFDVRWNNGVLNPAFGLIKASDFEVIQRGWVPPATPGAALSSLAASPNPVTGGQPSTGTVTLTAGAPAGGATVALGSASGTVTVPASVVVAQGSSSASFPITTSTTTTTTSSTLSASYAGVTRTTVFTVNPPTVTLSAVSATPNPVEGGQAATGTATLSAAAPAGGIVVALSSNTPAFATPASVTVPAGAASANFAITTVASSTPVAGTLSATHAGTTRTTTLTVNPPPPPALSIADSAAYEGHAGTTPMVFTVRLSRVSPLAVVFSAGTADATRSYGRMVAAAAGTDYVATTVTQQLIPAGATSATFSVPIIGDTLPERSEQFLVNVTVDSGATLAEGQATGTILNDDAHATGPRPGRSMAGDATARGPGPAVACQMLTAASTLGDVGQCVQETAAGWAAAIGRLAGPRAVDK